MSKRCALEVLLAKLGGSRPYRIYGILYRKPTEILRKQNIGLRRLNANGWPIAIGHVLGTKGASLKAALFQELEMSVS